MLCDLQHVAHRDDGALLAQRGDDDCGQNGVTAEGHEVLGGPDIVGGEPQDFSSNAAKFRLELI